MGPSRPIRGVIVDLDGVIRHWPADAVKAVEARAGLPLGSIADAAFRPERLDPALLGQASRAAWHDGTAAELEARFGPRARRAVEDWSRLRPQTDLDMVAVVRAIRRVARVALLTNAPTGIGEELAASGLDAEFDVTLSSAQLGVAKPDEAAFVLAAATLGLEPGECVVIDDDVRNTRSARNAGFRAITHRTPGRTERRLSALRLSSGRDPTGSNRRDVGRGQREDEIAAHGASSRCRPCRHCAITVRAGARQRARRPQ